MIVSDMISSVADAYGASEGELVRMYYSGIFSSAAIKRRRCDEGRELGDRYIFLPRVRAMDRCLREGIEGFFDKKEVCSEGLSVEGFAQFVEKLDGAMKEYVESGRGVW